MLNYFRDSLLKQEHITTIITHLNASDEMEVGYCGSCDSLFLFSPSQRFTTPSHPPVAKVPGRSRGRNKGREDCCSQSATVIAEKQIKELI